MQGPVCSSCGYEFQGLASAGSAVRCPECGFEQTVRSSPVEVAAVAIWLTSFLVGAFVAGVLIAATAVLPWILPTVHASAPSFTATLSLLSIASGTVVGALRFRKRLTLARRDAGLPPYGPLVRCSIAVTTAIMFGALYVLLFTIGSVVLLAIWVAVRW